MADEVVDADTRAQSPDEGNGGDGAQPQEGQKATAISPTEESADAKAPPATDESEAETNPKPGIVRRLFPRSLRRRPAGPEEQAEEPSDDEREVGGQQSGAESEQAEQATEHASQASGGLTPERLARLRALDEEIRRRDTVLRVTKDADRLGRTEFVIESADSKPSEGGGRRPERLGPGEERLSEQVEKVAGRVKTLEADVREAQRRMLSEARGQQGTLEQRLDTLNERLETLNERLGRLEKSASAHTEASGVFEKRLGRLEATTSQRADARRELKQKLAELEKSVAETLDKLSAQADLPKVVEELSARIGVLDARLKETEGGAAATAQLVQRISKPRRTFRDKVNNVTDRTDRADLNAATFEQLRGLGLSITQSARLISARDAHGGFTSIGQLDGIPGFPKADLKALKRRVYVKPVADD